MARNDNWLARHRDTRSTGCVEAFCAFDTGHDNSPRFWHVPDSTFGEDPARYAPDSPLLPLLAPDLTANVACQRRYFDHDFTRNSWGGPSNFLSLIRAPHAFEHHGRVVELGWVLAPALAAVCRMRRFPQTFSPWTGEPGYIELYSPVMLFTLDAVERFCGILPRADGEIWFTGLLPPGTSAVGYLRHIDGLTFESTVTPGGVVVYRDRQEIARFPYGWRMVTDRLGVLKAVVGMSAGTATGTIASAALAVAGNERVDLESGSADRDRRRSAHLITAQDSD